MKKSDIDKRVFEVVNSDLDLIGKADTPENTPNSETSANGTTDQNSRISHQNYGDDFLGRFGFYFFEESDGTNLVNRVAELNYERYREIVYGIGKKRDDKSFLNVIKQANKSFASLTDEQKQGEVKLAKEVIANVLEFIQKGDPKINEDLVNSKNIETELVLPDKTSISDVVVNHKLQELIEALNGNSENTGLDLFNVLIALLSSGKSILDVKQKNNLISKIRGVLENQ